MKIKIMDYIAYNNPKQANDLLERYGYAPSGNRDDISASLKAIVDKDREDALRELALIHPDKDLILSLNENQSTIGSSETMNYAGLSGEEYVQNLRTNTYWNKNNPQRPLPPDFFNDFANKDQDSRAIKEQVKEEVSKELNNSQTTNSHSNNQENGIKFTTTHFVILASALFVGYSFLKANK
jgi:hypothetical protein